MHKYLVRKVVLVIAKVLCASRKTHKSTSRLRPPERNAHNARRINKRGMTGSCLLPIRGHSAGKKREKTALFFVPFFCINMSTRRIFVKKKETAGTFSQKTRNFYKINHRIDIYFDAHGDKNIERKDLKQSQAAFFVHLMSRSTFFPKYR